MGPFFQGQVYEWGRFQNTDSHTRTLFVQHTHRANLLVSQVNPSHAVTGGERANVCDLLDGN